MTTPFSWQGRRVLVTGHTGFKGSWLCLWLQHLGAVVHGFSLPPATELSLYDLARVAEGMTGEFADIRDLGALHRTIAAFRPEIVFHLAAQAIVRESYDDPVGTFATNVMGTVNLLDAIRTAGTVTATVIVTSDKCYENRELGRPFREDDPMGGHDPYSASKGCAELVTSSYARSFFAESQAQGSLCSARAGNVFGGGDWAKDRLVPDLVRGFLEGSTPLIRRPDARRPWQHVLVPLSGYLQLAERMLEGGLPAWSGGWNFGPAPADELSVYEFVTLMLQEWGEDRGVSFGDTQRMVHEATLLALDSGRAHRDLNWRPCWGISQAVRETAAWYKGYGAGADMRRMTIGQIEDYSWAWRPEGATPRTPR